MHRLQLQTPNIIPSILRIIIAACFIYLSMVFGYIFRKLLAQANAKYINKWMILYLSFILDGAAKMIEFFFCAAEAERECVDSIKGLKHWKVLREHLCSIQCDECHFEWNESSSTLTGRLVRTIMDYARRPYHSNDFYLFVMQTCCCFCCFFAQSLFN